MRKSIAAIIAIAALAVGSLSFAESSYVFWKKDRLGKKDGFNKWKISGDGRYVATANDFKLWFLEAKTSKVLWFYPYDIWDVAVSYNGDYIAAIKREFDVCLFKKESGTPQWIFDGKMRLDKIDMSSDGGFIAVGGGINEGIVMLFKRDSSVPIRAWKLPTMVRHLRISADGTYIAAGTEDEVTLFHRDKNAPLWIYKIEGKDKRYLDVKSLSISGSGEYVTATTYNGKLHVFKGDKGNGPLWTYDTKSNFPNDNASISKDGKSVVLTGCGEAYLGFSVPSDKPAWKLNWGGGYPVSLQSYDGKFITIAGHHVHRMYFLDRDYLLNEGKKPFRIISATFPGEISLSEKGDWVVYDDGSSLCCAEVPPGIMSKLQGRPGPYIAGQEMNVDTHLSNPGRATSLRLEVYLTILPHEAVLADVEQGNDKDMEFSSKLSKIPRGIIGGATAYETDIAVDSYVSKDMDITFKIPPLLMPDKIRKALNDIDKKYDKLKEEAENFRKYAKKNLPGPVADELDREILTPSIEKLDEAKKRAKEEAMNQISDGAGMPTYPVPMFGFGIVSLFDSASSELLDRDTFVFLYLLSSKDLGL